MGIKYEVNESFFDKWSPTMAYVLGYFYADGNLENADYLRGRYIRFSSVEKYSLERIRKWLESEHNIIAEKPTRPNGRIGFLLRIGSHKLFNALEKHGLYPNRSLTVRFPEIPKKYLKDFVRGYFDGDGCVFLWRTKGKNSLLILRKLSVIFTSGSKIFLEGLSKKLKNNLDLKQTKIYNSDRAFQLRYATEDSVKLFKFMYRGVGFDSFFERKFNIFKEYFGLRPQRSDITISHIINKHNGHVVK